MLERDVAGCKDISDLEHIVAASLRGRPQFTRKGGLLRTRGRPRSDAPTISLRDPLLLSLRLWVCSYQICDDPCLFVAGFRCCFAVT